ncbi:MAG: ribosome assembly RNA-binding protein YhbY [Candidatus Marinimicrobia bacterium]|nr:ribosome assembly RNA-binding protein YhbY [Candidatus Neomarinimicrobiota bacterium]MCF7922715.1 ribosome assembly RNA-binding protein YhbY [Candidatus Neomarinimicrobiota bacterium]
METLSSKQKKYLKSKAHPLKALIQVGKSGVTAECIRSIDTALNSHEMVKVKFIAFKEEKEQFLDEIMEGSRSQYVSLIGHVLTLYREHEEVQKRKYHLPS